MNINEIKVSVIMPSYNGEKFIKESVFSVLNQTHKNVELIVVDDCSSDSSYDLVKSIKDDRIFLYRNETNRGAAYSRNFAIAHATGDYIAFLDGDDIWKEDKLEKQLKFMTDNSYDFSYTNYEWINSNSEKLGIIRTGPKKVTNRMLRKSDYIGCLTVMYRRTIFPDLCIPNDIKKRNDYALWLLLSERADCYLLDEVLALYRRQDKGLSSSKKADLFKYHIKLFKSLYGFKGFKAFLYSLRNVFYYYVRGAKYKKKIKS